MNRQNDLLAALGSTLGQTLAFDATGQCALEFAEELTVVLARAGDEALSLRVELLHFDQGSDCRESTLRRALALNYRQARPGLSIGLDETSSQLVLHGFFTDGTDPDFIDTLMALLEAAAEVRRELMAVIPQPGLHAGAQWLRG